MMGLLSGVTIDKLDLGGIISGFGQLAIDFRTAITGKTPIDESKVAELAARAIELSGLAQKAQTDINLIEAQSPKLFVSGWRPAVGWLCVIGLFVQYLIYPLALWILPIIGHSEIKLPVIDISDLYPLLFALLGVGGMRTFEKVKGVARN
jgi:hypothetical protein